MACEVSVVGKFPGKAVPFSFTVRLLRAGGAVVDPTTDVSSVGKRGGAAAAGVGEFVAAGDEGEGDADGSGTSPWATTIAIG